LCMRVDQARIVADPSCEAKLRWRISRPQRQLSLNSGMRSLVARESSRGMRANV
jgi:hypothetical protein